jgi:transposase-like protein
MAERGLKVDHTTIWRWTQTYAPEVYRRLQSEVKRKSSTWHVDETFVRIAGRWMYLFRAVDAHGQTVDFYLSETRDREAAKIFLQKALANPDNRPPHVFATDGLRSYPAALRELKAEGEGELLWVDNTSSDREINDSGRPPQGRRGTLASCYNREFMVQFFLAVLSAPRAFLRSRSDAALEILALRQ